MEEERSTYTIASLYSQFACLSELSAYFAMKARTIDYYHISLAGVWALSCSLLLLLLLWFFFIFSLCSSVVSFLCKLSLVILNKGLTWVTSGRWILALWLNHQMRQQRVGSLSRRWIHFEDAARRMFGLGRDIHQVYFLQVGFPYSCTAVTLRAL